MEFGFWIPIGSGIPDSYSYIPDSKGQDSRLHKQIFLRSRIPHLKCSRIASQGVIPHLLTERSVIARLIATPTTIMSWRSLLFLKFWVKTLENWMNLVVCYKTKKFSNMSLFVREKVWRERWVARLAQGFQQTCHKRFVQEPYIMVLDMYYWSKPFYNSTVNVMCDDWLVGLKKLNKLEAVAWKRAEISFARLHRGSIRRWYEKKKKHNWIVYHLERWYLKLS